MGETKYFWQETRTKNGERFLVAPETTEAVYIELSKQEKLSPFKVKDIVIL